MRLFNTKLTLSPSQTFLGTITHRLLRADVKDEFVKRKPPAPTKEFQRRRPEYLELTTTKFGQRLCQERRYRKFCAYLEEKRALAAAKKKPFDDPRMTSDRQSYDDPDQDEYDEEDEDRIQDARRKEKKRKTKKKT